MIFITQKSVKSLFAQHAIACVLCELLCLELFYVFFQHENRFRYKFFDIVQFSRSCQRLSRPADDLIILPQKRFFVKLYFFEVFGLDFSVNLEHLESLSHSCQTFSRLLVLFELLLAGTRKSFFCLSAWRSSIIPYPAPDVNTFLQISSGFFRTDSNQLHPLVFFRRRLSVYYNVLYKRAEYRQHPLLRRGKPYFLCADCQEVRSQILFRKFSVIFGESYKTQNVVVLPLTYH